MQQSDEVTAKVLCHQTTFSRMVECGVFIQVECEGIEGVLSLDTFKVGQPLFLVLATWKLVA
eukprot:1146981-Pelagomonas_calceolata.AAC.4